MDPIFASVMLGFFALIVALVAISVAIAYRQNDIAQDAIKHLSNFYKPNQSSPKKPDVQDNIPLS